jgi:hypothetical protein
LLQGGDVSLALAHFLGPLVAAVSLQGASYVTAPGVTRYKEEVVQPTEFTWADDLADWDGSPRALPIGIKGGVEELIRHPDRQILFERSAAPVLGMVGEEDSRDLINIARFNFARAGRAGKLNCRLVSGAVGVGANCGDAGGAGAGTRECAELRTAPSAPHTAHRTDNPG